MTMKLSSGLINFRPHIPVIRYSLNVSANTWASAMIEITVLGDSGVDMTWFHVNVNNTLAASCGDETGKYYDFSYSNIKPGIPNFLIANKS